MLVPASALSNFSAGEEGHPEGLGDLRKEELFAAGRARQQLPAVRGGAVHSVCGGVPHPPGGTPAGIGPPGGGLRLLEPAGKLAFRVSLPFFAFWVFKMAFSHCRKVGDILSVLPAMTRQEVLP